MPSRRTAIRIAATAAIAAAAASVSLLAACGGSDSTAPGPISTTTYVGTFASAGRSGSFSLTLASSATGTLSTIDGTTATLSGTFNAGTGAVDVKGGEFHLVGSVASASLTGSISSSSGTGSFTAQSTASGATQPSTYCGTYSTTDADFGWFNIIVSATNVSGITHSALSTNAPTVTLTGTVSGASISLTLSQSQTGAATLSADGKSLQGTFTTNSGGSGKFAGSTADCGAPAPGAPATPLTLSGLWATPLNQSTIVRAVLIGASGTVSGSGTITVNIPAYTGNDYTITTGSFSAPNISFSGTLGANPDGQGGSYVGAISFTGTVNGNTMTGTLVYTPPRTKTQTFAQQTVTGLTLTRG